MALGCAEVESRRGEKPGGERERTGMGWGTRLGVEH